jgi:hypothetical protein
MSKLRRSPQIVQTFSAAGDCQCVKLKCWQTRGVRCRRIRNRHDLVPAPFPSTSERENLFIRRSSERAMLQLLMTIMRTSPFAALVLTIASVACGCQRNTSSAPLTTSSKAAAPTTSPSSPSASTPTQSTTAAAKNAFRYIGYHNGVSVVEGTLEFAVASDGSISGDWNLRRTAAGAPQNPSNAAIKLGPQVGQGELIGEVAAGQMVLRTTSIADYEVILVSTHFNQNEISGIWQYRTFVGVETEGTFRATKP